MQLKQIIGALLLLLTAIIWGFAFVAQKTGLQHIGPCTFNGVRSIIGASRCCRASCFSTDSEDESHPSSANAEAMA